MQNLMVSFIRLLIIVEARSKIDEIDTNEIINFIQGNNGKKEIMHYC